MPASNSPKTIADILSEIRASMALDKAQGVKRIPIYVLTPKMIEELLRSEINEPDQGNKSRIVKDHAEATGQPIVEAPMSQAAESTAPNAIDDYEAQLRAEAEAWVQAGLARRDHLKQIEDIEQALVIASRRISDARDFAERAPDQVFITKERISAYPVPTAQRLWAAQAQVTYNQHIRGDFINAELTNTQWLAFCRGVYLALQADYQALLSTCGAGHSSAG